MRRAPLPPRRKQSSAVRAGPGSIRFCPRRPSRKGLYLEVHEMVPGQRQRRAEPQLRSFGHGAKMEGSLELDAEFPLPRESGRAKSETSRRFASAEEVQRRDVAASLGRPLGEIGAPRPDQKAARLSSPAGMASRRGSNLEQLSRCVRGGGGIRLEGQPRRTSICTTSASGIVR